MAEKNINIVVDQGNTAVKVAVFEQDKMIFFDKKTSLYDSFFTDIVKRYGASRGIVSSVSDAEKKGYFRNVVKKMFFLTSETPVPFVNSYQTSSTLGVDRIALASAAVTRFSCQNVLVIDAGTCITYDFIDKQGVFQGGAISPGIRMRLKALHQFTAKLPLLLENDFDITNFVGKNTKDCMLSGVFSGVVHEVEQTISKYRSMCDDLQVVITGGDGVFLEKNIKSDIFASPYFLLEGLNAILEYQHV